MDKALYILPWLEARRPTEPADVYLLTALIFVCAKTKRVPEVNNPRPLFELSPLHHNTPCARTYPSHAHECCPILC